MKSPLERKEIFVIFSFSPLLFFRAKKKQIQSEKSRIICLLQASTPSNENTIIFLRFMNFIINAYVLQKKCTCVCTNLKRMGNHIQFCWWTILIGLWKGKMFWIFLHFEFRKGNVKCFLNFISIELSLSSENLTRLLLHKFKFLTRWG